MQDVIPPINGHPRGALRPPVRVVPDRPSPPAREAIRPTRSIDGIASVSRTPVAITASQEPLVVAPPVVVAPVVSEAHAAKPEKDVVVEPIVIPKTKAEKKAKRPKKKFDWKRWLLIALAIVLVVVTGYVAIDTWLVNAKATNELSAAASTTASATDGTWTAAQEGKDETKVTGDTLSKYTVAADLPRALYIDKLHIAARVLPMSVSNKGSIQAPLNIYDSGWYSGSVKPGETGAMFIDGHASGPTREGLFAYLDTLKEGDTLQVEKGNGTKLTYKVVHTEVVPLTDIDMKKVLLPYNNVTKGLNLMTCTGKWLPKEYTYDHRVVVYTQQL